MINGCDQVRLGEKKIYVEAKQWFMVCTPMA